MARRTPGLAAVRVRGCAVPSGGAGRPFSATLRTLEGAERRRKAQHNTGKRRQALESAEERRNSSGSLPRAVSGALRRFSSAL
eukprot:15449502-Alexandrium_andersonii.AAC.1